MFTSFAEAVTSASPASTAVMRPVASTVTTSSSEEVHSMVSFEAASAIFSCSALSSVPYSISSCCVSPFSITTFGGNPMELMSTPHPTSDSAIAAAAMTIDMIFFFIFNFLLPGVWCRGNIIVIGSADSMQLWISSSTRL